MAARRDVLLAGVLDLILSNIDKIVDDTSLEKLLDVLESNYKNVKQDGGMCVNPMILEFFSRVKHVQCRAATISFALRLCGIVSKCSEGFHVMSGLDNVLQYLFDEILEKPELWEAPAVRDSYFKAAFAILNSKDGFLWAQNSGTQSDFRLRLVAQELKHRWHASPPPLLFNTAGAIFTCTH